MYILKSSCQVSQNRDICTTDRWLLKPRSLVQSRNFLVAAATWNWPVAAIIISLTWLESHFLFFMDLAVLFLRKTWVILYEKWEVRVWVSVGCLFRMLKVLRYSYMKTKQNKTTITATKKPKGKNCWSSLEQRKGGWLYFKELKATDVLGMGAWLKRLRWPSGKDGKELGHFSYCCQTRVNTGQLKRWIIWGKLLYNEEKHLVGKLTEQKIIMEAISNKE